jgi:hypothetical protein
LSQLRFMSGRRICERGCVVESRVGETRFDATFRVEGS